LEPRTRFLISGVLAAIVFGIGFTVAVTIPGSGGDVTDSTFTKFYNSDPRMTRALILAVALVAGCLLMLWFFTELQARVPDTMLSRVGYRAATIGVVALPIGAFIMGGPAGAVQSNSSAFVGVPTANAFAQGGLGVMLIVGMTAFALSALLFSLAAGQAGLFPKWLKFTGVVLAVLTLGSFFWIPGYFFVIWVLLTAIYVGTRSADVTTTTRRGEAQLAVR
jgi:hypothetical protein